MKKILLAALFALPLMTNAALIGFNAEDGSSETCTVSVTLGAEFSIGSGGGALGGQYIEWVNGGGVAPETADRVSTYEITFEEPGVYELYARVYVGPVAGGDDSFYYGYGFGIKDPAGSTNDVSPNSQSTAPNGDWILVNNILGVANVSAEEYVWINFSALSGSYTESGVAFTNLVAGTETFQIGAREDGLRIDAFAFGTLNDEFTTEELDAAVAASVPDATFSSSPVNGETGVALDSSIVVTATDYGVEYGPLVSGAVMVINSNTVAPVVVDSTGTNYTTFTYTPASDLEYETEYAVQLQIFRTDNVTNTVDFSFTTIRNYRLHVLYSGINKGRSQPMLDFLETNYPDVLFTYGDYSNITDTNVYQAIAAADLFIIGRKISSTPFADSTKTTLFNALTNPVVCFTSYAARPDSGRLGWHDGGATGPWSLTNAEMVVTAAGADVFGVAANSSNDWYTVDNSFYATGSGNVGDGEILATLGGDIVAAHWSAGDMFGSGVDSAGGERLLFNLTEVSSGSTVIVPDTEVGQQALLDALNAYTPLGDGDDPVIVEPSVPVIATFTVHSGSVSMSWVSESGVAYNILSKPSLSSGSWTTNLAVPGTGSTVSTNFAAGAESSEVFRLEAFPE